MGKVFTSKFVGTGPSSYEIRIYRATVLQMLRNTVLSKFIFLMFSSSASVSYHHFSSCKPINHWLMLIEERSKSNSVLLLATV
jgi:hypothetical protein